MFEGSGTINEENLRRIIKYLMPSNQKMLFILIEAFSIVIGIVTISVFHMTYGWIFFLLSIIFGIEYLYVINKFYKLNVERLEETVGKRESRYNVYFDENEVIVNNLDTGGKAKTRYNLLRKCVELANEFVIITKSNQYIIISKNNWDNEKVNEFKIFISEKCNKLKIK